MLKPVLITGASSGIGEAAAVYLAHKGFRVYAGGRRVDRLKALEGLGEGRIRALELDVTDEASIARALDRIGADGAPLYGLVNNAGVSVSGPIEETPIDDWRRQFETNLFGLLAVTKPVMAQMRAAGAGRIVNIGSIAGRVAAPFMGAYAASKHALEGATDAMRLEAALYGVKVSLIRPGFIRTSFGDQEQEGLDRYIAKGGPYAAALARVKAWHAKGHPTGASPDIVAEKIHDALTAARPSARYTAPVKYMAPLLLRNLLPAGLVDRVVAQATGLGRRP